MQLHYVLASLFILLLLDGAFLVLCLAYEAGCNIIFSCSERLIRYPFLRVYFELPHVDSGSVLCVGSEWHRFPSSFFIPDYVGQVRWLDDGFRGLLPIPFNSSLGGTSAAPSYFNNKNEASEKQYVSRLSHYV